MSVVARKIMQWAILLSVIITLTACGFRLRDSTVLPPQLKTLYVKNDNLRSSLTPQLTENFQALGVHLARSENEAPLTLVILNDGLSQSSSAIGSAQQLNTVTLTYNATVGLKNKNGQWIMPPLLINSTTTYLQNANQILGDTVAIPAFEQQLVRNVVNKILVHLNALNTRKILLQQSL